MPDRPKPEHCLRQCSELWVHRARTQVIRFNFYDNSKKQFCLNEAKLIRFSGIPNRVSQKAKKESKLKIQKNIF